MLLEDNNNNNNNTWRYKKYNNKISVFLHTYFKKTNCVTMRPSSSTELQREVSFVLCLVSLSLRSHCIPVSAFSSSVLESRRTFIFHANVEALTEGYHLRSLGLIVQDSLLPGLPSLSHHPSLYIPPSYHPNLSITEECRQIIQSALIPEISSDLSS